MLLQRSKATDHSTIPRGIKENVTFVLSNTENITRKKAGRKAQFFDDCGVYKTNTLKTHHFVQKDGRYMYIEKRGEKYVTGRTRTPLEPQPTENDVLILKRYYSILKRSQLFKRRISWLENCPKTESETGLLSVEYIGIFPVDVTPHGNAKSSKTEYVRTAPSVIEKVKKMTDTQAPRAVYGELILENSTEAPRDIKQCQNATYAQKKKERGDAHRQNPADDLQYLLSTMDETGFIQEVIQIKGCSPCIVAYTDDQIMDIQKLSSRQSEKRLILGVDRTFNIGPCYVTLLAFKNHDLVRRSTQAAPIFLGPVFLHFDASYQTYHRFFSHLQTKLDLEVDGTETRIVFESDEEKAMTKALRSCFPLATHTLCCRHVEENIGRYLEKKIGTPQTVKNRILRKIFGEEGLLCAKDESEFDLVALDFVATSDQMAPGFGAYFEKILPTLRNYIFMPSKEGDVPPMWKNNSCEAINHILKMVCQWKTLRLPELVTRLHLVVKMQYADVRRALHGQGNFELTGSTSKYRVNDAVWVRKTEEEKDSIYDRFMRHRGSMNHGKTITSTDGKLRIKRTPKAAKKPAQKTRPRGTRTTTM